LFSKLFRRKPELITDLTVKVLGHMTFTATKQKPFAPDAWTTRRARYFLPHFTFSPHRRIERHFDCRIRFGAMRNCHDRKTFHPIISHIRKAFKQSAGLSPKFSGFLRDGAYQLRPGALS